MASGGESLYACVCVRRNPSSLIAVTWRWCCIYGILVRGLSRIWLGRKAHKCRPYQLPPRTPDVEGVSFVFFHFRSPIFVFLFS